MNPYTAAFLWLGTFFVCAANACADWAEWLDGSDD
jgi:hypothetical protein